MRPKYACHHSEGSGDEQRPALRVAPAPPALIPKGLASEGLLAFIATAKFCDALPLYRQERQLARLGVELSRRTMSDWMIATAGACELLLELLLERLHGGPKPQIDETTVQVLKEPDRANTTVSYVWVARGGPPETPVLVYRNEPSRAKPWRVGGDRCHRRLSGVRADRDGYQTEKVNGESAGRKQQPIDEGWNPNASRSNRDWTSDCSEPAERARYPSTRWTDSRGLVLRQRHSPP